MRHHVLAIALSLFCELPAAALDLPSRKAGLWELKTTHEDSQAPPEVMQQCIDASTDKLVSDKAGGSQDACSKPEIRKSGSAIVTESRCRMGHPGKMDGTVQSRSETWRHRDARRGEDEHPGFAQKVNAR
jgi:hypothetical protein